MRPVNIIEHIHGQAEISFRGSLGIFRLTSLLICMYTMAVRVVEFSNEVYKIRKILHKNQHTQWKLLNFENWTNGEPQ